MNAKHIRNISIYFASGHKPSPGPCYICFVNNDVKTASCPSSLLPVQNNISLYRTLCLREILSLFAVSRSITGVSLFRMLGVREIRAFSNQHTISRLSCVNIFARCFACSVGDNARHKRVKHTFSKVPMAYDPPTARNITPTPIKLKNAFSF